MLAGSAGAHRCIQLLLWVPGIELGASAASLLACLMSRLPALHPLTVKSIIASPFTCGPQTQSGSLWEFAVHRVSQVSTPSELTQDLGVGHSAAPENPAGLPNTLESAGLWAWLPPVSLLSLKLSSLVGSQFLLQSSVTHQLDDPVLS